MSMENFIRNEFENHLLTLVYIMFLILVTTVVSMKAHGIITNHRESVFIGISSGLSIPLWIAWTLIAGLNRTSDYAHQYGDACIAFGLFLTGALVLFAMFLPKVRQMVNMGLEGVYLEDDRDTNFNGSVIMPPSSYKSGYRGPASVVYVNGGTVYSESIKDPCKFDFFSYYLIWSSYSSDIHESITPTITLIHQGRKGTRVAFYVIT